MKKPPDVIHVEVSKPNTTTENWIDLMDWSLGRDMYLYGRALDGFLKSLTK